MMLHLGRELERDEFVIHEFCDNQLCCNPDHMIVGTSFDRNRVQYAKGHRPKSGKKGNAIKKQNRQYKYTDDEMRFLRDNKSSVIAEKFGITKSAAAYLHWKFSRGYKWLK